MKFYLNGTQIYAETNTTLTQKVGTFSDGTLPLQISNVKNAILPMSSLTIENGLDKWHFVVVSDSVEVVRKGDKLYKHNLVVRTKEYELTKHLLRNNTFSQPKQNQYKALMNVSVYSPAPTTSATGFNYPASNTNFSHKDISLNSRAKITSIALNLTSRVRTYDDSSAGLFETTYSTILENKKDAHTTAYVDIKRYDGNTLVGTLSVEVGNQTKVIIDKTETIFQNITDNTVIKVVPNTNKFKFNITNTANEGAFAVVNVSLTIDYYYYSLIDIIKQIRYQSRQYYNTSDRGFVFDITTDTEKIATLTNTIAPEISFTGTTIYQALYQLFSYIDAIPTMDSEGKLTFDYLNNYNQNAVSINKADEKITLTDEYFTNKLVANYQRGKQENAVVYPAPKKKCRSCTRNYGIPDSSDYVLRVSKPIDYIDKLVIELNHGDMYISFDDGSLAPLTKWTYRNIVVSEIDIADRVFESSIYNSLDASGESYWTTYKSLPFSHGSNYIELQSTSQTEHQKYVLQYGLNFMFGMPDSVERETPASVVDLDVNFLNLPLKYNIHFYIEYHAIFDGRVEQVSTTSKYEGETYVNQESSSVSLNRMGNNLQGLIAKLGNETENITLGVSSYGSRMKAGSLWVDDDGNRYIANTVRTTFSSSSDKVIVEAEFTKNFNLISQYTKVDQDKRFYEISESLTSKGYENITEYVYFSYDEPTDFTYKPVAINYFAMQSIIERTLLGDPAETYRTCDYATFKAYTFVDSVSSATSDYIYIPMHIYGSGNSLCFEMDFDSPINAGDRLTGTDSLLTKTTLYTEGLGFADKVDIKGWHSNNSVFLGNDFPSIPTATVESNDNQCFAITGLRYYKKPNEIFHLNYALAFMGDNFFFGNKFIEQNGIMSNNKLPAYIIFYKSDAIYSIIDNKVIEDESTEEIAYSSIDFNYYNTGTSRYYLKMTIHLIPNITCKSWCLADENGNVYLASNKEIANNNEIVIYIIPRRNRI